MEGAASGLMAQRFPREFGLNIEDQIEGERGRKLSKGIPNSKVEFGNMAGDEVRMIRGSNS